MEVPLQVNNFGQNAGRVVGIDERPNTCFTTKKSRREFFRVLENMIFYKKILVLFTEASVCGIVDPVAFAFS